MKAVGLMLMGLALLGVGTSVVQAQCCGNVAYTSYYTAPTCSGGSCGTGSCSSGCGSCYGSYYSPTYTSYYSPYYTSYYSPYYTGYGWGGWGGGFYTAGYSRWGGGCCGW